MLSGKQERCIALMLEGNMNQKQIAQEIHVAESTIVAWKKSKEFMAAYNNAVKDSIAVAAGKAVDTLLELLKSKNELIKLNTAKDILDRAGLKTAIKIEAETTNTNVNDNFNIDLSHLTIEELKELVKDES